MKTVKIALLISIIAVLFVFFLKNYCLDKGILALKEEQYEIAIKYLKPIAMFGDADAQRLIGECYAFGFGLPKNVEKAIYWFRRSAKKNNCIGNKCIAAELYFVGEKFLNGVGVETNKKEASFWIKKSAENGYPEAIDFLSNRKNGDGAQFLP